MEAITNYFLDEVSLWAPKVFGVIVVVGLFFIITKVLKRVILSTAEKLQLDGSLTILIVRSSSITLAAFGLVTALATVGINVSALVAGLGLTGFALGFALKDTISNLLSGVLILLYQPFIKGDRIKISGYEGFVISIDLRYTELDFEGNKILIPNSKLFTDPITVLQQS